MDGFAIRAIMLWMLVAAALAYGVINADQPDGGPVQLLNDKVVLITGATDGLGRALARAADEAGATVLVHGRSEERIADTLGELSDRARSYRADLSSLAEVRRLADDVLAAEDRLDILVNNAGIGASVPGGGEAAGERGGLRAAVRRQLPRRLRAHPPAARAVAALRAVADRQRLLGRAGADRLRRRDARALVRRRAGVLPEQARADPVHVRPHRRARRQRRDRHLPAPGDVHADEDRRVADQHDRRGRRGDHGGC